MPQSITHILPLRSTIAWIFALALFSTSYAQSVKNKNYYIDIQQIDGRYGLESMMIRDLYQDKKGFIWISTPGGLAQFNGHQFRYFKDPKIIGAINTGIEIFGEIDGKLLVAENRTTKDNPEGILEKYFVPYLLDPVAGQLLPFSSSIGKNAPINGRIQNLAYHRETLYIGLKNGQIYAYSKGKWNLFYADPTKAPIHSILIDSPEKPFWVVAGDTLRCINPQGKCIDSQYVDLSTSFWELRLDKSGTVWINTIQPEEWAAIYYKSQSKPLQSSHPVFGDLSKFITVDFDREGRIWLWRENNFHVFDQAGQKICEIPAQTSMQNIPRIYFDGNNRAWLTQRERFIIVRITKMRFEKRLVNPSVSVRQMVEVRPGEVWAGTYSGLFKFSPNNSEVKKIATPTPFLFGLCKDGPYIWIGTHGNYLIRIDDRNERYEKFPITGITEKKVSSIHLLNPFVDKRGDVWVGSNLGIFRVDTLRKSVYRDPHFNTDGLEKRQINFQWENEEGIWTATNEGLYLLDPDKGIKASFPKFSQEYISYIHEKPKGVFWIATRANGLLKWEHKKDRITRFGPEKGIVNPNLHAIFEDDKGYFWLPSDRGLIYFDPNTQTANIFYESDGLSHDEFNRRSYLKLSDGTYLFGGIAGINRFNPKDFEEFDRPPSPLYLTNYDVWDPENRRFISKTSQFLKNNTIILHPGQISFQIEFALLDYDKLSENRYAYKIEGIDKDWTLIRENHLRFTSLPYGKFTLRIKGAAAKGTWSPNELSLPIEVQRPVYLKRWFLVLFTLAILIFIWAGVRWRLYRLDKIKQLLEREVAARTGELEKERQTIAQQKQELEVLNQTKDHLMAIIGHELRGPMLSIQNIGYTISYLLQNGQVTQAASLGGHIRHRVFSIRMLLDNLLYWGLSQAGKQEVFREQFHLRPVMIESFELVEFWITSKHINLTIFCAAELNLYTDRNILRIVLLNLLTNAIKFTHEGGTITLTASQCPNQNCLIEVSDSGNGMDAASFSRIQSGSFRTTPGTHGEKGTGLGLALCHKLLESLGGRLSLHSEPHKGCTFTIHLPPDDLHAS